MGLDLWGRSDIKRQLCSTAIDIIAREQDPVASRSALLALCSVASGFGISWQDLCVGIAFSLPGYSARQVENIAART